MRSWPVPALPSAPGRGAVPLLYDSASRRLVPAAPRGGTARLYVCGITPYDATHLGHASTYIAFDTLQRVWRDAGYGVIYAQNVTDVDDPLLERATATGIDWRELAESQIELFRADMTALEVIPPDAYIAVTDVIDDVARAVAELLARGLAYRVEAADASDDSDGDDIYFDNTAAADASPWVLGEESGLSRAAMIPLFGEHGGDPDRPGKRDALDPLLWRAVRDGEPSWPSPMGLGRPGWHIECAVIAIDELDDASASGGAADPAPIATVQGGGSDLVFPHHDMSAGHVAALSGRPLAAVYAHSGMVAYRGEKMSKSLGNLVLVSRLRERGVDPRAIRLAVLAHHYRADWEWTDEVLTEAEARLARWLAATARSGDETPARVDPGAEPSAALTALRGALHLDLDTPRALEVVDEAAAAGRLTPDLLTGVQLLLGIGL